jgi:hypothetical protein
MALPDALQFLKVCAWLSLLALVLSLVYAALFRRLNLDGLLTDKATNTFSLARLQLVGTSSVLAIMYLQKVAESNGQLDMPAFEETTLAALSGGAYGVGKLYSSIMSTTGQSLLEAVLGSQRRTP